jgi:hypothetical protein
VSEHFCQGHRETCFLVTGMQTQSSKHGGEASLWAGWGGGNAAAEGNEATVRGHGLATVEFAYMVFEDDLSNKNCIVSNFKQIIKNIHILFLFALKNYIGFMKWTYQLSGLKMTRSKVTNYCSLWSEITVGHLVQTLY